MLKSMSIVQGVPTALDYIVVMLSDKGNLQVLLFLYLFSGLVLLIKNSGGIEAFSSKIKARTNKKRSVFYTIWVLIPFTFIDCGFRVVATGSMIQTLGDKYKVAKERLAMMLNNTASPIIVLITIATTFVGYNIGLINQGLSVTNLDTSGYSILVQSIPFQFFSIVLILVTFLSIYFDYNPKSLMNDVKDDESENDHCLF